MDNLQKNIQGSMDSAFKSAKKNLKKKMEKIKKKTRKNINASGVSNKNTTRKTNRHKGDLLIKVHSGPDGLNIVETDSGGLPADGAQSVMSQTIQGN